MPHSAVSASCCSATHAEAFARRMGELGAAVFLTVSPDGRPFLTFAFSTLPPAPAVSSLAALIRHRFSTEEQFRKDLFGWLLVEGRVHQLFAERQPERVVLDAPAGRQVASR